MPFFPLIHNCKIKKLTQIMRKFLSVLLLAIAALATSAQSPDYIFYFIGDGMGVGPVMTAQAYNRDVLHNDSTLLMMRFPVASMCMTYSASHPITDSAAAGTALSTGSKTKNGMLGMNPDTIPVYSVATQLKNLGYGIGIVTSVYPDDATPGAFYAHAASRKMYYDIDCQAAECGYEFLAGAGLTGLVDAQGDTTDILDRMAANKVQMIYGPSEIPNINSERVFLLNPKGTPTWNIGYTIDSIPDVLNLPLMTQTCLNHLQNVSPNKFFMMVEGGNIDHALHGNDGGAAVKEVLNFDQALAVAYDFYLAHPDNTLIIVTADHDTGGMSHIHSKNGQHNPLSVFDYQKMSKEVFSDRCKEILASDSVFTWEDMAQYLSENFGFFTYIQLKDKDVERLKEKFTATFEQRNTTDQKTLYANFNAFAVEVFRIINDAAGVGFTTTSHSGNPVPVFAIGVGAERFSSMNNNIDIPQYIRFLTGINN